MATVFLKVANWDEYQHYKDRNPPWIKLHNQLLDNYDFCSLPDASKAHLFAIWMLASRSSNKLPHDAGWISRKISATEEVDLDRLISAGFLEYVEEKQRVNGASTVLADSKQNACLETETETEAETEAETEKHVVISSPRVCQKYSDDFEKFWEAYPGHRRGNKKRAFANWKKIDCSLYPEITQHVFDRKTQDYNWVKERGKFIIQAEGFLSGERWLDEWVPITGYSETTATNIETMRRIGDLNG